MYAVFIEVNADSSHVEQARETLPQTAVPFAKEMGARAGYWIAPSEGCGNAVIIFDSEQDARAAADQMKVGEQAGAVPDVTFRKVEVREVLAQL